MTEAFQLALCELRLCGCSSVVERQLPKLNVVSSSLIIRLLLSINKSFVIVNTLNVVLNELSVVLTHYVSSKSEMNH